MASKMERLKRIFTIKHGLIFVVLMGCMLVELHQGQTHAQTTTTAVETQSQVVEYPASFFSQYQPNTALDMVRQLPGFQLESIEDVRGYAAAVSNILLNNRRPSMKQVSPATMLGRIPASNVVKIDLIRGQMKGIHTRGQDVVANIILREEAPAVVRWEAFVQRNTDNSVIMPGGALFLTHSWSGIDYNTGVQGDRHAHSNNGSRNSYDAAGNLTEDRTDSTLNKHFTIAGNLNTSNWIGDTLLQVNTKLGFDDTTELVSSDRIPQAAGSDPRKELFDKHYKSHDFEIGLNAERSLHEHLIGKAILFLIHKDRNEISDQAIMNSMGEQNLFRVADIGTMTTEGISRLEFDWFGFSDHLVQLNIEAAYNSLDGSLIQTVNTGAGPVIEEIPGANTKVEELRGNALLKDIWTMGQFEFELGLGAEVSTISQTGDAELERDFFFLKPQTSLSYSPLQGQQSRLRLAREISQLDFNDFVSAVTFQDDFLTLGNPNLRPESIWVAEASHERQFGSNSVIKVTLFHHWISEVEDLLPLTAIFEAPGNIGDGRRWGVKLENRIPLDFINLDNARLNIRVRWQDSTVIDPVTGLKRVLSGQSGLAGSLRYLDENVKYTAAIDYRQDFETNKISWGWESRFRAKRTVFRINELDIFDEGMELNAFVETTRWLGLKTSLRFTDLLDHTRKRNRTIFTGQRGNSAVDRQEIINYNRGRQAILTLSGSF